MTSQEFEKSIQAGSIPLLCYLYGDEPFLLERCVERILSITVDPGFRDFNFNLFYGNESKGVDILNAAMTLPMFCERRTVLVRRADALRSEELETLLPYINNPSESTCLIFTGTKTDQRKKFFQEIKKRGELVEYKKIYEAKLGDFIKGEARLKEREIEPAAVGLLSAMIGNNLQELSSQIEKLAIYTGQRKRITIDDVKTIASDSKAFTVFELCRFVGMRDMRNAVKSLDTLFRDGEQAPAIIGALARHSRQLWRVRELLNRNAIQGEISREAGINPYFLQEIIVQAKKFSVPDLKKLIEELHVCDMASKSGGNPHAILHQLLFRICLNQTEN